MKNLGIAGAVIILAAGTYYVVRQAGPAAGAFTISAAGAPVIPKPADTPEQKLCSEKSKVIFETSGYSESPLGEFTAVYAARYNPRLGRCLLAITSTFVDNGATLVELFDADDKKLYGQYNLGPSDGAKPGSIVGCTMTAADGAESTCTTPAAWTAFITGYMN